MRRGREIASLARATIAVALLTAANGCRCRGEKVGDKRALACAEVASKSEHKELDLGEGRRLVRDGVRATISGASAEAPVAVTSFEGGAADLTLPAVSAVFVVGLGGLPRDALAAALTALGKRAPVVAVMGPGDDVDGARAAISDAGARVIDGSVARAFTLAGVELVTLPGSDDAASLADHGRGCVLRADDVRALAQLLGPKSKPRVSLSYASPSRDPARPVATDALTDVTALLVSGPLDRDSPGELAIAPGAPVPLIPVPRARAPRTTSSPGVIAPGYLLVRAEGANLMLKREP